MWVVKMRSNIEVKNKLTLVSQMGNESCFQILKYASLNGASELNVASAIRTIEGNGKRLKQVRILLNDSAVKIQQNALSYMKGFIERSDVVNDYKGIKKVIFGATHMRHFGLKTVFSGSGEILLEPSFNDFTLIELVDEEIIINEDMFYACDNEIDISLIPNDNNKIKLSGSGVVAFKLPVPEEEIIRCKLYKDRLVVNGDFIVLRSANIKLAQEKYERIIDEELVEEVNNVYIGIGEVWILPTKSIYDKYIETNCFENDEEN